MKKELQELKHEAWPGYRTAFIIVFSLLTIYLLIILLSAPDGGSIDLHH
jgi:multisubunit Na+/H+ antiporter MnhB subunit